MKRNYIKWLKVALLAGAALVGAFTVTGCGPKCPDAGTVCTVVGTGAAALDTVEGSPGIEAPLYLVQDATFGPDGNLYIADWNNHRIRVWNPTTDTVHTVAGTGITADGPPGPALESAFNHPTNIAFDGTGDMLIATWHNSRLKKVVLGATPADGTVEFVCGNGGRNFGGDGMPADTMVTIFDLPVGVVVASDGTVFIADQANNRIRCIDTSGVIDTCVGTGTGTGINMMTMMPNPECMGASGTGTEDCWTGDGGPAIDATINNPRGQAAPPAGRIALDANDNLFIADTANHVIRRVDAATGIITTFAGTGHTAGFGGDGGAAVGALLNGPKDVVVGSDGALYIADTENSCVRMVDASGTISTVAGVCGTSGDAEDDLVATEALFDHPFGVELGPDGNLYVSDTENSVIRVVYR